MIIKSRHCLGSVSCIDNKREKRGTGTRQRVSAAAKVPGNWQKFLANVDNKKELFSFLSGKIYLKKSSLMKRMCTSPQVMKSFMWETVNQWSNATMRKRTPVS